MYPLKIAVAVPTYQRKELLRRLIDTVPANWFVCVSDNASSLLPLDEPLPSNVTVSHGDELVPMFANWNRALAMVDASCSHVFVPSDDDIFLPGVREVVEAALQKHPEADIRLRCFRRNGLPVARLSTKRVEILRARRGLSTVQIRGRCAYARSRLPARVSRRNRRIRRKIPIDRSR